MSVPFAGVMVEGDVGDFIANQGSVFRSFVNQDSGCRSYGLEVRGQCWFIKHAIDADAVPSLERAVVFHRAVTHPAIVPLAGTFATPQGPALVYPWADGDLLYHPAERGNDRDIAGSPHRRFRELARGEIAAAIDAILDAHLAVAAAGFVAVDLYDGCFLYDFVRRRMRLIDLDEYRQGPFALHTDRLPGSTRFMAPEEWLEGSRIDERTTVFNLGRSIAELAPVDGLAVRMQAVVRQATHPDPDHRFGAVAALADAARRAY